MDMLTLSKASQLVDGKIESRWADENIAFQFVNTDTRTIKPGELFIAIKGDHFDGHHFLQDAKTKGAIAALIEQDNGIIFPAIKVEDTLKALGKLAAWRRQQHPIPMIAVTGSCGKTTTRSMLTAIMQQRGQVLAPKNNFNNEIGLPLTLLRLTPEHEYAVIEIGANHFGEIAHLTKIAHPDVTIITTIAPVHLEGFGDLPGIAKAKSEIFQGLPENGIAVINDDNEFAAYLRQAAGKHRIITFGLSTNADVYADNIQINEQGYASFTLHIPNENSVDITLPMLGKHHVMNALAAATGAYALKTSLIDIKTGIDSAELIKQRLIKRKGIAGATIIDDSYGANPTAVNAALELLEPFPGEKVLVFSDMKELGEKASQYHIEIGKQARKYGINRLYAFGDLSRLTVENFGDGGKYFATKKELIDALLQDIHSEMVLLVKGSRTQRMEDVVKELIL